MAGINGNELVRPFNVGYDMKRNSKTDFIVLNQYMIESPKILPFARLRFPTLLKKNVRKSTLKVSKFESKIAPSMV